MRRLLALLFALPCLALATAADEPKQPEVPKGTTINFSFAKSKVFPGTTRNVSVYVPDQFSRVFSAIGTYVGLRGGDVYPTLIRKYEPKPIRVFLQDGSKDLNIYGGDWWMANQTMERALAFAGYEVKHEWGEGMHDGK